MSWASFCEFFPAKLQARSLNWEDLLLAAYAVYARIYAVPPGQVFEKLHTHVRDIV